MRKINQAGLDLIKHFESFSPGIYICPSGYPTIGYGHVVRAHEKMPKAITKTEAEAILRADVMAAEIAVSRLIPCPLTDNQFSALVSFTFNAGAGALQRSTLRQRLIRGDYDVENEFLKWVFGGGKKLRGLMLRRQAEADLFSS